MSTVDRSAWLAQVGKQTEKYRERRAAELRAKGRKQRGAMRLRGCSDEEIGSTGRWHENRARGQEERFERVQVCGAEVVRITCLECGLVHERTAGCRIALLCLRCRGAITGQKRAAFGRARTRILDDARARGLLNPNRRGGRFGEKFLTLTAPHRLDDSIEGRISHVLDAWAHFLRRLRRWLAGCGAKTLHFFRVVEWTPGADGLGHPHLHVWLFSPYLEQADLEDWWRRSLGDVGTVIEPGQRIVVDVRAAGASVDDYLIKYLLKDRGIDGALVDPAVYGRVYAALDQRRRTQCSRGFARLGEREKEQCECGSTLPRNIHRQPRAAEPIDESWSER